MWRYNFVPNFLFGKIFFVCLPLLEKTDQWEVAIFKTPPPSISDWLTLPLSHRPSIFLSGWARWANSDRQKKESSLPEDSSQTSQRDKKWNFDTRHFDRRTYSFKKKSRRRHRIREWRRERRDSTGRWRQAGARPVSLCSFGWTLVCYSVKH